MISEFSWSCWADSNCRPHPYQLIGKPETAGVQQFPGVFVMEKFIFEPFHSIAFIRFFRRVGQVVGQHGFQVTKDGRTAYKGKSRRRLQPQSGHRGTAELKAEERLAFYGALPNPSV